MSTPAGARRVACRAKLVVTVLALLVAASCFAHTGERGFVMLLPTNLFRIGGALAVAVSFLVIVLVSPLQLRERLRACTLELALRPPVSNWPGWLSSCLLVALIVAGFIGSRDPLLNPLPLAVWTVGWVGLTAVHALVGNLWPRIDPWSAPARWIRGRIGLTVDQSPLFLARFG